MFKLTLFSSQIESKRFLTETDGAPLPLTIFRATEAKQNFLKLNILLLRRYIPLNYKSVIFWNGAKRGYIESRLFYVWNEINVTKFVDQELWFQKSILKIFCKKGKDYTCGFKQRSATTPKIVVKNLIIWDTNI